VSLGGVLKAMAAPGACCRTRPWDRVSEMMVRQLLAQIDGEGTATVILPTDLVVRESA
jgi:DNA-binding LacI/PurR family transcriptional regulator